MATQWMRWNPSTHIFEYTIDGGTTWAPLLLNASVLNEGTVNPAQLPATSPTGDVFGPASAITNKIPVWANTTGKLLKDSLAGVDAVGALYERARPSAMGDWINIAYAAGNFTGSGSMTWTVASGAIATLAYMMVGRTAFIFFNLSGVIGGTASTDLFIALPFAPTASSPGLVRVGTGIANSWATGLVYSVIGQSKLGFQLFAGGNFPVSASNYYVQGMAVCQV